MTLDRGRVQAAFAGTLVDEWARAGITDAVVAPGSRSTPLVLALLRDGRFRIHVRLDERSAAFFALGLGLKSGRPAVVVTTSGTAAVELHPAVVEAHHASVPLIACTADRPARLHGVRAPQTVTQEGLFAGATRWECSPGTANVDDAGWWRSLAARSVCEAIAGPAGPGPVHLNLAFDEPLVAEPAVLPSGRANGDPWHRVAPQGTHRPVTPAEWSRARGVVVAGWGADAGAVSDLADGLSWPILADPRSGCGARSAAIAAFDPILRSLEFARQHRPDIVLLVGEPPASRVLAEWLEESNADTFVVDRYGTWPDPARSARVSLRAVPLIAPEVAPAAPSWLTGWRAADAAAQSTIDQVLAGSGMTEPAIARAITALPEEIAVFVSSSMPIRDVEWYGAHRRSPVLANRGANGIDGVVSTALGVAAADPARPVVVLLGDLAFLHDSNGLMGAADVDASCTFVVVDNSGGGIFSFLPQATAVGPAEFERLFATPHTVDLPALAAIHGVTTESPSTIDELRYLLQEGKAGVRLVHIRTNRDDNVAWHGEVNTAIAAAVDALM